MVTKLNPKVITDDMMYEGSISAVPTAELDAWIKEYDLELRSNLEQIKEDKMWGEIRRMARTNPTLQDAIDRVIMIYKLSKEYKDDI